MLIWRRADLKYKRMDFLKYLQTDPKPLKHDNSNPRKVEALPAYNLNHDVKIEDCKINLSKSCLTTLNQVSTPLLVHYAAGAFNILLLLK